MDLLYDFSQNKSPTDALSSKYKQSGGRNRMWRDIQRDVKKKQNKMEKETEKVIQYTECFNDFKNTIECIKYIFSPLL